MLAKPVVPVYNGGIDYEKGALPMKEYRLSTPNERLAGISFSVVMIIAFGILTYVLRKQIGLMLFCGLGMLLIGGMLVYYVISVVKAVCIVDNENKMIKVRGVVDYTVDVSKATMLQTLAKKNGQMFIRVLVFTDEDYNVVASIPTMFTHRQGIMADPMAKEMAADLGIAFQQNVPDWELDKKKYQEHQKEVAEQERREAKERREKRMKLRIEKRKNKMK